MNPCLPGTTIEVNEMIKNNNDVANYILENIFATGGLMLSQVSALTGLETHTVQNWVKRGFLSPPEKKMYSRRQFCRIVLINVLKDALQIDVILKLLSYINGVLHDESDDLIDDCSLYNYYVNMIYNSEKKKDPEHIIEEVLSEYKEPVPGGKKRLSKVLLVMYYATKSVHYLKRSEKLIYELE